MTDSADDLFVWGEDFEAIIDILDGDEVLDEQFSTEVCQENIIIRTFKSLSRIAELKFYSVRRLFYSCKQTESGKLNGYLKTKPMHCLSDGKHLVSQILD